MTPFIVIPGERVVGLGLNFINRLAKNETLVAVDVVAPSGVTIISSAVTGAIAVATVDIAAGLASGSLAINYTVTGTAGSIRKGSRQLFVQEG